LIDLLQRRRFFLPDLEKLMASDDLLGSFDIDRIEPEALLFQTGYLTIHERRLLGAIHKYTLGFPNYEVRVSLNLALLQRYTPDRRENERLQLTLHELLEKNDLDGMRNLFHAFFASIPHDWYRKNEIAAYEGFYASVVYCYFAALGLDVTTEDTTNKGRIDMTVRFAGRVYIFEFKVNEIGGPGAAMAQLKERKYHEKFLGPAAGGGAPGRMGGGPSGGMAATAADGGEPGDTGSPDAEAIPELYLVAIEFSRADRNVTAFSWERMNAEQGV
ncbi:MAG: PD-(D/E)XK nuclease domain-containing protein, partial [Deltaproteobacteria bacterium]|nr:PD-(D/E)XK nuclease domain-containing protein [Candidatus Anaeroferrophillacea bacterium]